VRLLTWRPLGASTRTADRDLPHHLPGTYVGYARYRPRHPSNIPPALHRAIGQSVEVGSAGVAPAHDRFAGQPLYLEWRRDDVFGGYLIPEQDLEFLPPGTRPAFSPFPI
jgi:hypothetical protein